MITGIILAGGRASRMGGQDKGLMPLHGIPLYQHVLTRLAPQVTRLCINANRNLPVYQQSGYPVFCDLPNQYAGPLAGILTGLKTIKSDWAIFAPCDVPNLPSDLVKRLWEGRQSHLAAYANDGGLSNPYISL